MSNVLPKTVMFSAIGALLACSATPQTALASSSVVTHRGQFGLEVLVNGTVAPTYSHRGESYVLGRKGQRYVLRVWNHSHRRVEAVVSVDGRDVIDGQNADALRKRGYLIAAGGFVDIDGWRISAADVAAFRFTGVRNSYAGLTGDARNVGVIGVAIFPERRPRIIRPRPIPYQTPYPRSSAPPAADDESADIREESAGKPSKGSAPRAESEAAPRRSDEGGSFRGRPKSRARAYDVEDRPGLGTKFGESRHSPIRHVSFVRENPHHPAVVLGLRYNDRRGLLAMGVDLPPRYRHTEVELRRSADPFPENGGSYARPPLRWTRR